VGLQTTNNSLIRNSAYNIFGQLIPILIGFFTIPLLIRHMGMDRFGLLSLLWVFLGYLTFFDLGLSRAIIKMVAEQLAGLRKEDVPQTIWTTIWIASLLSLVGTAILVTLSEYLVHHYFNIPQRLEEEAQRALCIIALSLPVVTLTSVFRGVLEAQDKFLSVNILQAINGTMTYLSPLVLVGLTVQIDHIIFAISAVRLIIALIHWGICAVDIKGLLRLRLPTMKSSIELVHFGSWLTISNIISPIMVYFDRFFLGSLIPVGELAYYTTPYEIITRVLILPTAVARTLFPAFASTLISDPERAKDLLPKVLRLVGFIMAMVSVSFIFIAREGLAVWLGSEFSRKSTILLQVFSIGVFFNGIANIPYTFIQSAGRPDLTAKIHIIELPVYLAFLWFVAREYGAVGAAWVWSGRLILDFLLLVYFSEKISHRALFRELEFSKILVPIILVWAISFFIQNFFITGLVFILVLFFYWAYYLRFEERVRILGYKPVVNDRPSSDRFGAIIVTFNPTQEFAENLRVIAKQFEKVCVIDNNSVNVNWVAEVSAAHSNVLVIPNSENVGLGKALNQGMNFLIQLGYSWVATFDQDSLPSETFLKDLRAVIDKSPKPEQIGILAPSIFERSLSRSIVSSGEKLAQFLIAVPTVITSGSLTNTRAFELVGGFEESFFIDYIDHNFSFRLRKQGFTVAECPGVRLEHRLGDSRPHQVLFKRFFSTHHSPLRRYYITRNRVQFYKEFFFIDPAWVLVDLVYMIKELVKIILAESQKRKKLKSVWQGFYDGLVGRSGPFQSGELS
jgi:O-antigen/teichoic acid export membrane protein/GT2 family glycosyltransferase